MSATTFMSNGLLGPSSSKLPGPTTDEVAEPPPLGGGGFKSNGLLGSGLLGKSESTVGDLADVDASEEPQTLSSSMGSSSFQPNGLLGSSFGSLGGKNRSEVEDEEIPESRPFKPNGLLLSKSTSSLSASPNSFTPTGLLSTPAPAPIPESQDDDLPPVSEAFGIRFGLTTSRPPNDTATSGSSSTRFHIRATTFEGKPLMLKRKSKVSHLLRNNAAASTSAARMGNLLDIPIHRLMDQLSLKTASKLAASERNTPSHATSSPHMVEDTLWVDRYRPNRFTELMGNERVARETMTWVKQWDWCVFGKNKGRKRPVKEQDGEENVSNEPEDEFRRPKERLLLISGPPGLGKTTLAHVVARQAGYDVMEINASDARSGQIVDDRIRPALESGSAVGSSKPVLLVIDEIDGATGAGENSNSFIHKLVQLTQERYRKKNRSGQRDPNAKRPILRPIICICNDINAASLAKLRPIALQIRFQRPADIHTVKRLREVCDYEGLKADSRALTTLVGIARGDLRGCLNTLQFIKGRNQEVTEAIIRGATKGMKEADTSISAVLNALFLPLPKKRVKELGMGEEDEARYVGRLSAEVDACGRDSTIAVGCFSHYATLRQHDANFTRYEKANEWLTTFDMFSAAMYTDGDFALSPYLPYMLVPFYPLFQERGGPRVERDQADWDTLQRTRSNEEIYKSIARGVQTASTRLAGDFRHFVGTPILQLEFAPYINRIISPPLRPVNSQIIKPEERALLTRLVKIMASLDLRFVQERGEDGQLTYRLDPPVDVFVTYDGKRAADIAVSRYAVRHMVAGEVDTELLARQADIVEKGKKGKHDFSAKTFFTSKRPEETSPSKRLQESADESGRPNKRLRTDATDIADRPPVDFFGRLVAPSADFSKSVARKNVDKKYRVTYKFKEGNSAAVRKPVKVGAFL